MSLGPVEQSVRQEAAESDVERQRRIGRAWRSYLGQAPKPLEVTLDGHDDNVRLNFAQTIVDKSAGYLFGRGGGLRFDLDGDDKNALDEMWPEERRGLTLHQLAVNGGVCGHVFARLTSDGRVIVWDPTDVEVQWADDDYENVGEYRRTWTAIDRVTGNPYVLRQRVMLEDNGRWLIVDERSDQGDSWHELAREQWAWDFSPVLDCQNRPAPNEFWGLADLEGDVLDLIEAMEALAGYMRKMVRHRGHPIPYVTGQRADEIKSLKVTLGTLLAIPNAEARMGQLEAGDLGAALDLYRTLHDALHEMSGIPEVATGKLDNVGSLSGLAISILYGPIVELTETKRMTYGPLVRGIAEGLLVIGGRRETDVPLLWPQIVPADVLAEAQADQADLDMGIVSKQTIAERRGYDWEQEQTRLADEQRMLAPPAPDVLPDPLEV